MPKKIEPASLRKSVSLEDLAPAQGVGPISDLDELSKLWPVNDDPDELLRFILSERHRRRRANGGKRKMGN
jgi:hypothetical protein